MLQRKEDIDAPSEPDIQNLRFIGQQIGERMLGTRGATRWLPIGLGLISLVGLFLGVTALLGGSGSGLVRLLVVLAFGGGALAGGGLHQLLGESR